MLKQILTFLAMKCPAVIHLKPIVKELFLKTIILTNEKYLLMPFDNPN